MRGGGYFFSDISIFHPLGHVFYLWSSIKLTFQFTKTQKLTPEYCKFSPWTWQFLRAFSISLDNLSSNRHERFFFWKSPLTLTLWCLWIFRLPTNQLNCLLLNAFDEFSAMSHLEDVFKQRSLKHLDNDKMSGCMRWFVSPSDYCRLTL